MIRNTLTTILFAASGLVAAFHAAPCRADMPADSLYWIQLERGDSVEARAAEMSGDFVRYKRADGSVGYVPANRVSHIFDAEGSDRGGYVLDRRKRLGGAVAPEGAHYSSFRFRGGDKSVCGSFLLTEAAVMIPLKADAGSGNEQKMYGSADLGWMTNVGRRSALGASGFWESGTDHNRGGVRLRYRRWLGHRTSVELSPGIVVQGNYPYNAPGFIGQVALNAGDYMSVVVEQEISRYESTPYYWNGSNTVPGATQRSTDTTYRLGLRGGSYVGLGASLLAAIAIGAIAASFSGSSWM